MTDRDTTKIFAAAAVVSLATLAAFTLGSGVALSELPLDDGWIHLVYARGILRDGLPTYNDGVPEAGFSSLSWLLAELPAVLFARLTGGSPALAAKLTSLLFAALSAAGAGVFVRRVGGSLSAALLAVLVMFVTPGFAFASLSGMEVTLTTAAILWGFIAFVDERPWRAGVLFGVAAIARLEATVVLAVVAATSVPIGRARVERAVRLLAPAALMLAVWAFFNLAVTDYPLPNTFYVKAGRGSLAFKLHYLATHFVARPGYLAPALVIGLTVVAVARPRHAAVRGVAASALAPLVAMLFTHALIEGEFYSERYFVPFISLLAPVACLGADVVASRGGRFTVPVLAAAMVASTARSLVRARESYRGHCATIRALATEPARWVAEHTPKDAVVGVIDAGAMRWFSGRRVVDLGGLNDKRLAHAQGNAMLEMCLSIRSGFQWVALPGPFLATMASGFDIAERATFSVERWWIIEQPVSATVVVANARAKPPRPQFCEHYLRSLPR